MSADVMMLHLMVDHSLLREIEIKEDWIEAQLADAFGEGPSDERFTAVIDETVSNFQSGTILKGRVVNLLGDDVIVDVGLKSEGVIPLNEWEDKTAVDIGDKIDVWLEAVESDSGLVLLSKRKADRLLNWQRIIETCNEGDTVTGRVTRKIKGGLLVDIGVPVFLPASQVDIRRPGDVSEYIGRSIEAMVLKIDTDRRNIVVSRRKLIEEQRQQAKEKLLAEIEEGQIRKGQVKNIADFGAFVDLGGIDGLLHITDMSWDRIGHPSEVVKIDEEIEVKVLNVDRDREKIALGLKQRGDNPWLTVDDRLAGQGRGGQSGQLRLVHQARAGGGRAGSHFRDELDAADSSSVRGGQAR
jgi:small subunit ribosomal protein S1